MPSNKVGGIAYVKIDENQYPLRGNLKYSPGKRERESVVGQDGEVHGVKEMGKAPFIEMDVTDRGDISIEQLQDITDGTVTAELNNGKVFVLKNAAVMNQIENDTAEGQFTLRFEGKEGKEIVANG